MRGRAKAFRSFELFFVRPSQMKKKVYNRVSLTLGIALGPLDVPDPEPDEEHVDDDVHGRPHHAGHGQGEAAAELLLVRVVQRSDHVSGSKDTKILIVWSVLLIGVGLVTLVTYDEKEKNSILAAFSWTLICTQFHVIIAPHRLQACIHAKESARIERKQALTLGLIGDRRDPVGPIFLYEYFFTQSFVKYGQN